MRRVRTLRLSAPEQPLLRRGNLLVEDALRTASLPEGDGGRLIVVRSLDIGAIQAGAAPTRVARAIERSYANVRRLAMHASNPSASMARVVYFSDVVEAHTLLALRLARFERVDGWFWPVAVRAFRVAFSRDEALRAVLFSALDAPAGTLATVVVLQELLRQRLADPLLAALRWQDGVALARAYGWSTTERILPLQRPDVFATPAVEVAPEERRVIRRWVATWGVTDARSTWLAASILAGTNPIRLADPRLVVHAQRLLLKIAADSAPPPLEKEFVEFSSPPVFMRDGRPPPETRQGGLVEPPPPDGSALTPPPTVPSPATSPLPQSRDVPVVAEAAALRRQEVVRVDDEDDEGEADEAAPGRPLAIETPLSTDYAGLYFVLRLLQRLGIEAAMQSNSELIELQLPLRILRRLAVRLRIPEDDAVLLPLADVEPRPELDSDLDSWIEKSRRLCRRLGRMGLSQLVRRPGGISFTRTHLDVTFGLNQVDIRVRRAGLDLDPGWLPWFGRVVMFHYFSSEERQ